MKPDRTYPVVSSRLRLNITEWGDPDAPPLILQHGGRDHSRSWDRVAGEFASEYRVIAPDLRGHGDSEWTSDGGYEAFDFVYDMSVVMDELALPPCPFIGHSYGGNVGLRYAGLYPDRFTLIINIEGLSASPAHQAKVDARDMGERLREWFELKRKMHGWAPKRYPGVAAVARRLAEVDPRLSPEFADHLAMEGTRPNGDGTVSLKYDPAFHPSPPIDIPWATRQILWSRVTAPVLFIYGRQSFATSPLDDGRMAHFQDARLAMIDDAGHWVHHDQFEKVIALAKPFLAHEWNGMTP